MSRDCFTSTANADADADGGGQCPGQSQAKGMSMEFTKTGKGIVMSHRAIEGEEEKKSDVLSDSAAASRFGA
jgi:hypothetical protein